MVKDSNDNYREQHKPVAGKYDGKDIVSCAWCGKTLDVKIEELPVYQVIYRMDSR